MKKFLASLLAVIGIASQAQQPSKIQTIDPRTINFSMATLSADIAPLLPAPFKPGPSDLVFHEDEWTQVEFFPKSQIPTLQKMLQEFKEFEVANRVPHGWRNIYARKIQRSTVMDVPQPLETLATLLKAKVGSAPLLFTGNTLTGRVKDGFTLDLGGNVALYGYISHKNMPVLAANVGRSPDDMKLTAAFIALNTTYGLVLVDWRAQLLLTSVSKSGQLEAWRP